MLFNKNFCTLFKSIGSGDLKNSSKLSIKLRMFLRYFLNPLICMNLAKISGLLARSTVRSDWPYE